MRYLENSVQVKGPIQTVTDTDIDIVALLRHRAENKPSQAAYIFLGNGETESGRLSFSELDRRTRAIAAHLQAMNLAGQRALLLYPPGLDYVEAFFACLYAGVIAVPAYPPSRQHLQRLLAVISDAAPALIMTTTELNAKLQCKGQQAWMKLESPRLATDILGAERAEQWIPPALNGDSLAFLQYTSGSTGDPKGVMVSHGNLLANQAVIQQSFGHTAQSTVVGWLPLYHDMGLIGNILQPLYVGATAILMPPMAFLEKPIRWLRAISVYQAVTSGGPNFAYELCVRKVTAEQKRGLDLSSWELAFNGSEPVRSATLERFSQAFAECGFRYEAFYPCYGLAEATLFVTGPVKNQGVTLRRLDKDALAQNKVKENLAEGDSGASFVACGHPWMEHDVRIVDPQTHQLCSDGEIGEIWINGPSVAQGYWNRPQESEQSLRAVLAGSRSAAKTFLRTGDLGFMEQGQLFVTGRMKDLIILRGRNVYPQDIEYGLIESVDGLRQGGCAAFSVTREDEECLVVVAELTRQALREKRFEPIFAAMRQILAEDCEVAATELVLVSPGTVPKTSSGKLRRQSCRQMYREGRLTALACSGAGDDTLPRNQSLSPTEEGTAQQLLREALLNLPSAQRAPLIVRFLCAKTARLLQIPEVNFSSEISLRAAGLDSLKAVELKYATEGLLGTEVPLSLFLSHYSVMEIAKVLASQEGGRAAEKQQIVSLGQISDSPIPSATLRLSLPQQAIWTVHQLEPNSIAYNLHLALQINGLINFKRLQYAFDLLLERHEMLRTVYRDSGDGVIPQLLPLKDLPDYFSVIDAVGWSESDLQANMAVSVQQPFDLAQGPLLRVTLYHHTEVSSTLLFCAHHIALDLWSVLILLGELKSAYVTLASGENPQLPKIKGRYSDFIAWQTNYLASPVGEKAWEYWRTQLAGKLPRLDLPSDRPRSAFPSFHGASEALWLGSELTQKIQGIAERYGATLYMVLLAAFKVLLYRYSGQSDLIVGSPTAGRAKENFTDCVGYFVNPVALRTQISGKQMFPEFLEQVRCTVLAALEYQNYPFSHLVERLQPERNIHRWPIYQVMFAFQSSLSSGDADLAALSLGESGIEVEWPGLKVESLGLQQRLTRFDLLLMAVPSKNGLLFSFQYDSGLFDYSTVRRLTEHYRHLLQGITASPRSYVAELPLLSQAEREQLCFGGNKAQIPHLQFPSLSQLFEETVAQAPDRVAVIYYDQQLSFAELNRKANCLAHYLRSWGIGPEVLVGICMDRSLDLVVALLAVLKAGGAYVPIEPDYPQDRIGFILEDANVALVLTQERILRLLPSATTRMVCIDRDQEEIAACIAENPRPIHSPDNLAYVIYTSGSTGRPKGVLIQHGSLINLATALQQAIKLDRSTNRLQVGLNASIAFDASVKQILQLLRGHTLHLLDPTIRGDADALVDYLQRQPLDLLDFTPTLLETLLAAGLADHPEAIPQCLLVGGEKLDQKAWQTLGTLPGVSVYNVYGPTECTVDTTYCHIPSSGARPTIGQPLANIQVYILDSHFNLVPIGVAGELCIGGAGVARGYLNQSGLTAEHFIPNPYGPLGSRLYRSGDLARYCADGKIEYLERLGQQVKIRGFRIELGEIEACLVDHEQVWKAVVTPWEVAPGEERLVAYVVGADTLEVDELLPFLKQKLPDYMLPVAFIQLPTLPLAPSGKIDRKALPVPDLSARFTQQYEAPRNQEEKILAAIWAELLHAERVGIHDNFFELGGDSIRSIQVASRANRAGLKIKPQMLFQYQTIALLAAVASVDSQDGGSQAEQGRVSGEVPLTPIQRWFFALQLRNPHHRNQALWLEVVGKLSPNHLEQAIKRLLEQHDALRLRFAWEEGGWHQYHAADAEEASSVFHIEDLRMVSEDAIGGELLLRSARWQASLDISQGPLLRVVWFDLGERRPPRVLLVIHHLVVDAVSWRTLIEDLETLCQQIEQGRPLQLPAKTASYRQWAVGLVDFARTLTGTKARGNTWPVKDQSLFFPPVDYPEGANTEANLCCHMVALDVEQTHHLTHSAPAAYRSNVQELLLAAFARVITRWANLPGLLLHLESYGRDHPLHDLDITRTVGWFTVIYPIDMVLPDESEGLGVLIKQVKEQVRRASGEIFEYSVRQWLCPNGCEKANTGQPPESAVLFNYLGVLDWYNSGYFRLTREQTGPVRDCRETRAYEWELNASITDGRLQIEWAYSAARFSSTTIGYLAEEVIRTLRLLIQHCLQSDIGGLTPLDFPLAHLDQEALDRLPDDPRNIEDIYPLAPMQEGMLFHTLMHPHSGIYLMQDRFTLQGEINEEICKQAWQRVVDQHPALRTSFVWGTETRPHQIVHKHVELPFKSVDLRELSENQQQEWLNSFLDAELEAGVDFTRAPLLRIALVRLQDEHYVMIRSHHHILIDAWCTSLMLMDFKENYEALRLGKPLLNQTTRPFKDYIAWLQRQDWVATEQFWRRYLQGFTVPTPLVGGRATITAEKEVSDLVAFLSEVDTQTLDSLARVYKLTPNTFIQAAWALLLNRYSGHEEVLFGVTVAGRPSELPDIEKVLGLFINSLPLRVRVRPEQPVLEFLKTLLQQNLELRRYEYTPLVQIQGWSQVLRGQALFQHLVVFENYPIDPRLRETSGDFQIVDVAHRTHTNYPITVVVIPGNQLHLQITYQHALFEKATVERLLHHFKNLLGEMIRCPEAPLGELPLLSEEERRLMLTAWNRTSPGRVEPASFVELFESQAAQSPAAIAVSCGAEQLSYGELNLRANRIAHRLIEHGVRADSIVALLDDRNIDLLVMIVAVLKAGGAYLPLEPSYPETRLKQIAQESHMVLIGRRVSCSLSWDDETDSAPAPFLLQLSELEVDATCEQNPARRYAPDNLAYVIYTSGSTGDPKGVMIEHKGMLNNLLSKVKVLELGRHDVIAQTASQCFDISVWQFLTPLICGACVQIYPEHVVRDPEQLLPQLAQHRVTVLESVPSLIRALLEGTGVQAQLPQLRWLMPTGEVFPPELCCDWMERYPHVFLLNAYGPAECSDDVAYYLIESRPTAEQVRIAIGKPLDNFRLYLVNGYLQPVSVGVPGEICVAGIGVGRGYLNRPELTAAVFLPDPFEEVPGSRLYRTGDLGVYREDGNIEYLGRLDHQVKIRGYRIELGEIESWLLRQGQIKEAVVIAREGKDGNQKLVAYIVPRDDSNAKEPLSPERLRQYLAEKLPAYMVPAAYMWLPDLPRTTTGKIDRKALPEPEFHLEKVQGNPKTPTEEIIAGFWMDLLELERVGSEDNFFELGGHSLLATQLISRLRRAFKVELPLRILFDAPTVAQLATAVNSALGGALPQSSTVIKARQWDGKVPLSFAQQRLWFMEQLEPGNPFYNFPTVVRLKGKLNLAALEQSINEIVRRHHVLRAVFDEECGQAVQFIKPQAWVPLVVEDLSAVGRASRDGVMRRRVTQAVREPFNLTHGPLLRTCLYILEPGDATHTPEQVLLINFHHIVFDGWSFGVLTKEFEVLYPALSQGASCPLPELNIQYSDFADWQQRSLQQGAWDRQLAYWKHRLAGSPLSLQLPCDRPRSETLSNRGAIYSFAFGRDLSERLTLLCRQQGVTLFMAVTAAFQVLLFYHSGQKDFIVGADVANRNRDDTEQLIGFFVNLLPLRADLSGNPTFVELLARVRTTTLEAYAHQDLPFDKVVEALRPERSLNSAPIFQVKVVYHNVPLSALNLPGLEITPIEVESNRSELDLVLHIFESTEGLRSGLEYRTELFDESSIADFAKCVCLILERVTRQPGITLEQLTRQLIEEGKQQTEAEQRQRHIDNLQKLRHAKRKSIQITQAHTGDQS